MRCLRATAAASMGALLLVACSMSTESVDSDESAATSAGPLKVATFNAGLVRGGVALADERLPLIGPALRDTGADVLCLQEVWSDEDYAAIASSLSATHPHAFRKRTEEKSTSWFECGPIGLYGLKSCVDDECTPNGVSAEECVQNACKAKYAEISDQCKICLAANTDSPTRCLLRSNDYVQGGRNGLAIFSKHPIEDARFESFGTAMVHRGVIRATIKGRAIACTHLSADLTTVPYPEGRERHSWQEEQAAQVDQVVGLLPPNGCRIVMGDLNTSPDAGEIRPEVPTTLEAFGSKGFREPWTDRVCTWCAPPENPLASGREKKIYDHVLVSGCASPRYRRIMDHAVDVTAEGRTLSTRLSDHFGVMAELP